MTDKFFDTNPIQTNTVIDFKTGKPKNNAESSIIIGLPYNMRVKETIRPFLELVWELEHERIIPEIFKNTEPLLDYKRSEIPLSERGAIESILKKQT